MRTWVAWVRIVAGAAVLGGAILIILAPFIGSSLFQDLWGVEPLTYIGAFLLLVSLGVISLSYVIPRLLGASEESKATDERTARRWGQLTQQYFELFDHDLGRPLRRILGKERELRAALQASRGSIEPSVKELLDEIERQAPNFRLMMLNIRVLIQMEAPEASPLLQPVEPSEVVRKIVDRYTPVAAEEHKVLTWWAEPAEFGVIYSDASVIEHIVANLVDNAVRFADKQIEVKITRNPTHFFVRIWDDGPGIAPHHRPHIFDRGWTPEVSRREEKSSSGLGLYIAWTLATRHGGDLTVESVAAPDSQHHAAFLLSLPLGLASRRNEEG